MPITWPWLTNTATASGSTMARLNFRMFWSGHLKRIWPLWVSGTAMNSRRASCISPIMVLLRRRDLPACAGNEAYRLMRA